ncbi:SAM-dependent RNA methyltransferase [Schizophyllum commune]
MEEDEETPKSIPPWVELEYSHMRILAGPGSTVHFTNLSEASRASLSEAFAQSSDDGLADAQCHKEGIIHVLKEKTGSDSLDTVCLLDPKAEKELSPEDGDGRFEWFLFGVSDDPPRDRTAELRKLGFPARRLGPIQMTTDTALGVTKLVVEDKTPIDEIPYVDMPTIRFNAKESVEMPFRYISRDGEPVLPPGMKELLHEDLNKSFDF